jgi:hypothetical protein
VSLPVTILVGAIFVGGISVFASPLTGAIVTLICAVIAACTRDKVEQPRCRPRPAPAEPVDLERWAA